MCLSFYSVLQPSFNKYFKHPNVNYKVGFFSFFFYSTCEISEVSNFDTKFFFSQTKPIENQAGMNIN